jgi:hypothetical protein
MPINGHQFRDPLLYTTTRNRPLQGNRHAGLYPLLVYTYFPVRYEGNSKGAPSARLTGALRALVVVVVFAQHAGNKYTPQMGVQQKSCCPGGTNFGGGVYTACCSPSMCNHVYSSVKEVLVSPKLGTASKGTSRAQSPSRRPCSREQSLSAAARRSCHCPPSARCDDSVNRNSNAAIHGRSPKHKIRRPSGPGRVRSLVPCSMSLKIFDPLGNPHRDTWVARRISPLRKGKHNIIKNAEKYGKIHNEHTEM